jgi:hypothetical protein
LNKKKQKFKTIRQPLFAPHTLPRIAVHTELSKSAALLPMYAVQQKKYKLAFSAKKLSALCG